MLGAGALAVFAMAIVAELERADLTRADLRGARGLTVEQLAGATQ